MKNVDECWAGLCGWTLSVLVHTVSLGVAIVLAADFSLLPQPRPFQWNVSLVIAPRLETIISELPLASAPGPLSPQSTTDSQISQLDILPHADSLIKKRESPRSNLDVDTLRSNRHVVEARLSLVRLTLRDHRDATFSCLKSGFGRPPLLKPQ